VFLLCFYLMTSWLSNDWTPHINVIIWNNYNCGPVQTIYDSSQSMLLFNAASEFRVQNIVNTFTCAHENDVNTHSLVWYLVTKLPICRICNKYLFYNCSSNSNWPLYIFLIRIQITNTMSILGKTWGEVSWFFLENILRKSK
jgi:hypothetical protein